MKSGTSVRQISENLFLRPLLAADAEDLARMAGDPSVWENLRDSMPVPYTYSDAMGYIETCMEEQPPVSFGVFAGRELAGLAGLVPGRHVYRTTGEVGYWIGKPYRGRGIATSALRGIMRYAFEEFGFYKLSASVLEGNTASCRVLEKCGFAREAVLKNHLFKSGAIFDEWRFAYFNPAFDASRFGMEPPGFGTKF